MHEAERGKVGAGANVLFSSYRPLLPIYATHKKVLIACKYGTVQTMQSGYRCCSCTTVVRVVLLCCKTSYKYSDGCAASSVCVWYIYLQPGIRAYAFIHGEHPVPAPPYTAGLTLLLPFFE